MKHNVEVVDAEPNGKFAYVVKCTCGWVGRAYTSVEAERMQQSHLNAQGQLMMTDGVHHQPLGGQK